VSVDLPERPDAAQQPRIGVDEWVASVEGRRERYTGPLGLVRRSWDALPPAGRLGIFVVPAALFPFAANSGDLFRYGVFTLLYALLALGLNTVVGFAGLLDLGYIAFFGFGAYGYGILASPQFDNHFQAEVAIPIMVVATAVLGLLVGLTSRRLLGDYLAIVTLFFGQAFVVFVNNANAIKFPHFGYVDLTGSTNGINNIDPLDFFGYEVTSTKGYFYVALIGFALVATILHLVSESRTGRAWKALREDPLAAEVMSIPVNRLKLLAFVFGAAVAGLTGTMYSALITGAFPGDYDIGLLITIYAVVILGGAGSLAGVVLGAIVVNIVPELLRSGTNAHWLFYGAILLGVVLKVRPWQRLAAVLVGVVAFGFVVRLISEAVWARGTAESGGANAVARAIHHWVLMPSHPQTIANVAYVGLIALIMVATQLRGLWRTVVLVPILYLASFVWENRLIFEVAGATRLILLGALLVVLMNARPQGLLGTARVEIA
jgi:ABC-type branched-subunit amino acid transport system permease subunit